MTYQKQIILALYSSKLNREIHGSLATLLSHWEYHTLIHLTTDILCQFQFSCSVVSNSLQPHRLQHASLPCLSTTPRACSDSCPSSRCYHPTISSSVVPFSSCLQSFPASSYSPRSLLFTSGGQNWNFHFNISPSNGYSGLISFRMDWLDLLAVQGVYVDLKAPDAGKDWRKEEKGTTDDETVGLHHQLDEHEFEQAPGVGDG